MNETTAKIDNILSKLAVYLITNYGMSPRDAVGMVMQSSLAEEISSPGSKLIDCTIEQLSDRLVS